ncbi:MAG: 3-oxoacyl-ACP reductase FabG [Candidatus Sungbacteria bacterium]|nr:3-oxoacyl-ACP reductase FabG [Candidatus Sungbacteria bacterium]
MKVLRLKGKVALITGSSTGIGRATALACAAEGARVVVNCARTIEQGRAVAAEIKSAGGEAIFIQADVSREADVKKMFAAVAKKWRGVDILVNNAGIARQSTLAELTPPAFMHTLAVNLLGPFLCIKYAAPYMRKQKSGAIVNVASIRGLDVASRKDLIDYSASKAGVINLTISLAKELGPDGIRVNAVAPGITESELVKRLNAEAKGKAVAGTIFKRMAQPEEIAGVILFLASDDASYITGETITADAGYRLTEL